MSNTLSKLTELQPLISLSRVFLEWTLIVVAIAFALHSQSLVISFCTVIIIGSRQHAIAILMHDAAHFRLFPGRRMNDMLSDLLLAFPLGVSTKAYRERHLAHHHYLNSEADPDWMDMKQDPDWVFPKTRLEIFRLFTMDLLGLNSLKTARIAAKWSPKSAHSRIGFALYWAIVLSLVGHFGFFKPFLLFWFLPAGTILGACFRLRGIAEHLGLTAAGTRTVIPRWWERALISPCNVNYHGEHHLYPMVPYYNLHKLFQHLRKDSRDVHYTHGYLSFGTGVLSELTT